MEIDYLMKTTNIDDGVIKELPNWVLNVSTLAFLSEIEI